MVLMSGCNISHLHIYSDISRSFPGGSLILSTLVKIDKRLIDFFQIKLREKATPLVIIDILFPR